jgi:hypothetical protein
LHDARHERVSSLVEAGWSDKEIMAQTGHLDPKSMRRYANLRILSRRQARADPESQKRSGF